MHQQYQPPKAPVTVDGRRSVTADTDKAADITSASIAPNVDISNRNLSTNQLNPQETLKSSYRSAVSAEAHALIINLDTKVFVAEVAWRSFQGTVLATAAPLFALGLINPLPVMLCGGAALLQYILWRYDALDNQREYAGLSDAPHSECLRPSLSETIKDLAHIFGFEAPRFVITEKTSHAAVIEDLLLINPSYMQRLTLDELRCLLAHEFDHIRENSELSKARLKQLGKFSDGAFGLLVSGFVAGACLGAMGSGSTAGHLSMSNWAIIAAFSLGGVTCSLLSKASTEFTLWRNRQGETRADLKAIAITGDPDLLKRVLDTKPAPPRELPESEELSRSRRNWPTYSARIALAEKIKLSAGNT